MSGTAPARKRIVELDALRGLAVMGIVLMNVYIFALPSQAYYNPLSYGGETATDYTVWWASFVFVEDKFRSLFAMMFGAGVVMLMAREEKRPVLHHYARMLVLFAIGMLHGILLADNDVLRAYAFAGLFLPLFIRMRPAFLYGIAIALIVMHVVLGSFFVAAQDPQYWEMNFGTHPFGLEVTTMRGEQGFFERVDRRWDRLLRTTVVAVTSVPLNLATMLVGVALWKSRMLAAQWSVARLLITAALCAFPAVFALFFYAWQAMEAGYAGHPIAINSLILSAPFDILMAVAYAALAMAAFQLARQTMTVRVIAAAGQLSLTNYLMTSLLLAVIFASWGLGLFGTVSRSEALLFSLVPIAAMLAWSPIWLSRFGQGPAERIWRAASQTIAGGNAKRTPTDARPLAQEP